MNDRATEWVERVPWRWGRNAAIFAGGFTLAEKTPRLYVLLHESDRRVAWAALIFHAVVIVVSAIVVGLTVFLIGLAARRRLRRLQGWPDVDASKAVAWLPGRYAGWGLVFGLLFPLSDVLLQWRGNQFQPWDTPSRLGENIGQFLGAMILMAIFTGIIGLISRAGLRRRLEPRHR